MNASPLLIEETNLSNTWRRTLEYIVNSNGKEITPLVITLTEFNESSKIREIIDSHLQENKLSSIQTVSETIFPESLYKLVAMDREALYREYNKNLPRIRKIDVRNSHGTYFERLINYDEKELNQLEIIISSLNNKTNNRRSKLQASIFNPSKDHTEKVFQGFPCLQHITFYKSENGGLILNSFYAIQYLYERAYGNWLGLINLGKFIANETGLEFERFNCFIGIEQLDSINKSQARELLRKIV
jgi:hypothetical protein